MRRGGGIWKRPRASATGMDKWDVEIEIESAVRRWRRFMWLRRFF